MSQSNLSLDLADARRIIAAGERKATELGIPYNDILNALAEQVTPLRERFEGIHYACTGCDILCWTKGCRLRRS